MATNVLEAPQMKLHLRAAIMAMLDSVTKTRTNLAFIVVSYQPLMDISADTRCLLQRPSCFQEHENRPDFVGRSVALLAPPHPKCPFQVVLLRVRMSLPCFLVRGYYEVTGL